MPAPSRCAFDIDEEHVAISRAAVAEVLRSHLRRIRLPAPDSLSPALSTAIKKAFQERDFAKLDELTLKAYGIGALPAFEFVNTRGR